MILGLAFFGLVTSISRLKFLLFLLLKEGLVNGFGRFLLVPDLLAALQILP